VKHPVYLLDNVEYINYLGSLITNDARRTLEVKSRIAMAKAKFIKKTLFISKLDLNLRKKLVKCYTWSILFYGTGKRLIKKVPQKYLEKFFNSDAGFGWV
jgi:hypothetical protein